MSLILSLGLFLGGFFVGFVAAAALFAYTKKKGIDL